MKDDEIKSLDDVAGPLTVFSDENCVDYRMREMIEYARLRGKETERGLDLTDEEIAMFIIPKK